MPEPPELTPPWPEDLRRHVARTVVARSDPVQVGRAVAVWLTARRAAGVHPAPGSPGGPVSGDIFCTCGYRRPGARTGLP